jgi:hypothetical protein
MKERTKAYGIDRDLLVPNHPSDCKGPGEVSVLQGGEGRIPLGERGPVDPVDVMGEADGERLAIRVLGVVALLDELL